MAEGSDSVEWSGQRAGGKAEILGKQIRLEVFRLYWVDGRVTSSQYVAKARLAWSKLSGRGDDAALVVMYTPMLASGDERAQPFAGSHRRCRRRSIEHSRHPAHGQDDPVPAPLIVHIVYRFGVGGLENGVVNLINRLPAQSWRHAVLSLTDIDPGFAARVEREDVKYIALGKGPGHAFRLYPRLFRLFRELRPAIVHTRNLAALEASAPAWAASVPDAYMESTGAMSATWTARASV